MPIFSSILSIFLLIFVGAIAQTIIKHRKIKEGDLLCKVGVKCETWSETLNRYVLYIALPALLFNSIAFLPIQDIVHSPTILLNLLGLSLLIGLLFFIAPKYTTGPIANAYLFGGFFGNVAYIGLPFLIAVNPMYGGRTSVIVALHVLVAFTLGISLLEYRKHGKSSIGSVILRAIKNPILIAVFLGLFFAITRIPLPATIIATIASIGGSATPVVLIALGMFMVDGFRFDANFSHAAFLSVLKLIGMPAFFVLMSFLVGGPAKAPLTIVEAAMPIALTNFALADLYPIDKRITANAIILSTLLSLITIPIVAQWVL